MKPLLWFALTAILWLNTRVLSAQSKVDTLNLTFTTIDVPGASQTNVAGINSDGDMVGWYVPTGSSFGHGFLLSGDKFTTLDYPGGYTTLVTGINDSGVIVGYSYITGEDVNGFTYQGGVFQTIQIAGYPDTYAQGIDNAGDIVGGYAWAEFGFLKIQALGRANSREFGSVIESSLGKQNAAVPWIEGTSYCSRA